MDHGSMGHDGMDMGGMNSTMGMNSTSTMSHDMGSMEMSGHGVFKSWSSYQLSLLFGGFDVENKWQFALTWFAVVFAAITYHILACVISSMQLGMVSTLLKPRNEKEIKDSDIQLEYISGQRVIKSKSDMKRPERPVGWQVLKLIHGLLSAVKYGLSLMLMLISMTFNPSLFLALVIGYLLGDYICCDFHLDLNMGVYKALYKDGGIAGIMIRRILCQSNSNSEIINNGNSYGKENRENSHSSENSITTGADIKIDQSISSKITLTLLWIAPRITSMIFLIILLIWIVQDEGSFGYTSITVFGWHALAMSLFVVVLMNEAMLTYTAPLIPQLANNRKYLKYFHSGCHVLSLTFIILGLIAIVDFNRTIAYYETYSAHSWLGIVTVALWCTQFLAGLWLHVLTKWPEGSEKRKNSFMEVHHFVGYCTYAMGLAACATGLQSMQSSDLFEIGVMGDTGIESMDSHHRKVMDSNLMTNSTMDMMPNMTAEADAMGLISPYTSGTRLSSAATIMLVAVGISTFATLKFYPRKNEQKTVEKDDSDKVRYGNDM